MEPRKHRLCIKQKTVFLFYKMDKEYLDKLRHSTAHLLAAAVINLWPNAKPTIGPAIENGFYYDFDFGDIKISEADLPKIEKKMHELVKNWKNFKCINVSINQIKKEYKNNKYKIELAKEFTDKKDKLTIYQSGEFKDLCRGGHVENPSQELKHFKLMSIAGAYWRGDENNPMLTRIYGTAFPSQKELDEHIKMLEEARERDHRKIGRELDLFTFSDLVGKGFPLYLPKGAFIRLTLNQYVEELQSSQGYQQVWTPQIAKAELFKTSGHYDKYHEDMFEVKSHYSDENFFLKPMNCPQHTQIYASRPRSYKELPIRITDFSMLYRDEKPGELNGLARVRSFSQDDCHIFCTEDQVDAEIDQALEMIKKVMHTFDFKYRYRLSTRDPNNLDKYLGEPETWDKVEKWAEAIMTRNKIEYYEGPGEAAFYAPKMDLMATDALGREWQLSTVQIDYVMPERFNLSYTDADGKDKHPIMIHRAIIGSPERFIMILLEHFAGALPLWLSPLQVKILPITEANIPYSKDIYNSLSKQGIRVEIDDRSETLQAKIRDAQLEKVPYMLILGKNEEESKTITVRKRDGENLKDLNLEDFTACLKEKIENKELSL